MKDDFLPQIQQLKKVWLKLLFWEEKRGNSREVDKKKIEIVQNFFVPRLWEAVNRSGIDLAGKLQTDTENNSVP